MYITACLINILYATVNRPSLGSLIRTTASLNVAQTGPSTQAAQVREQTSKPTRSSQKWQCVQSGRGDCNRGCNKQQRGPTDHGPHARQRTTDWVQSSRNPGRQGGQNPTSGPRRGPQNEPPSKRFKGPDGRDLRMQGCGIFDPTPPHHEISWFLKDRLQQRGTCYNCFREGHITEHCTSPPNPVADQKKEKPWV